MHDFLFVIIELFSLALTVEAKRIKTRCNQERVGHLEQRAGGRGHPWGIFFGFYKTRHILLCDIANCTMLRAVVLTQYWHMTDRRTDGRTDRQTELL